MLREMKNHVYDMYEAIQRADFTQMGHLVRKTWQQNQAIDSGTNPDTVRRITSQIEDPDAAARIRTILNSNRPNANARFVEMSLSDKGLQVSRS